MSGVQRTDLHVVDDGDVDLSGGTAERGERALHGAREARHRQRHVPLTIDDSDRHHAGPLGGALRCASCAS